MISQAANYILPVLAAKVSCLSATEEERPQGCADPDPSSSGDIKIDSKQQRTESSDSIKLNPCPCPCNKLRPPSVEEAKLCDSSTAPTQLVEPEPSVTQNSCPCNNKIESIVQPKGIDNTFESTCPPPVLPCEPNDANNKPNIGMGTPKVNDGEDGPICTCFKEDDEDEEQGEEDDLFDEEEDTEKVPEKLSSPNKEADQNTNDCKRTENVTEVKDDCPEVKEDCPEVKEDCPEVKEDCPEVKEDCPEVIDDCPDVRDDCEEVKEDCQEEKDVEDNVEDECKEIKEDCEDEEEKIIEEIDEMDCGCGCGEIVEEDEIEGTCDDIVEEETECGCEEIVEEEEIECGCEEIVEEDEIECGCEEIPNEVKEVECEEISEEEIYCEEELEEVTDCEEIIEDDKIDCDCEEMLEDDCEDVFEEEEECEETLIDDEGVNESQICCDSCGAAPAERCCDSCGAEICCEGTELERLVQICKDDFGPVADSVKMYTAASVGAAKDTNKIFKNNVCYLRTGAPEELRIGTVVAGGVLGMLAGIRRGRIRKVFYGTLGAAGGSYLAYPRETLCYMIQGLPFIEKKLSNVVDFFAGDNSCCSSPYDVPRYKVESCCCPESEKPEATSFSKKFRDKLIAISNNLETQLGQDCCGQGSSKERGQQPLNYPAGCGCKETVVETAIKKCKPKCPPMPPTDCCNCKPQWMCCPPNVSKMFAVPEGVTIVPISVGGRSGTKSSCNKCGQEKSCKPKVSANCPMMKAKCPTDKNENKGGFLAKLMSFFKK